MALRKRVEVLFDPEKFSYLEDLARREKTSVGNLIREAVTMVYLDPDVKKRREAVQWLTSQDFDFQDDWDALKKDLEEERYKQVMKSLDEDALG